MSDLEQYMIHKELGKFCTQQDGSSPIINLSLEATEEKANKVGSKGLTLTGFQTALFTFLHEYQHFKQFQTNEVTASEINDPNFQSTDKCKKLEKDADEAAVNFIKGYRIHFDPLALQVLANETPNIPKVGQQVQIIKDTEFVDTVFFQNGFHCGSSNQTEAVDIGQYKISLKQGIVGTINSVHGSQINLIDISDVGIISAYDSIKGRNITNQVQVYSCTLDFSSLQRI